MFKALLINPPRVNLVRLDTSGNVDLGEISSFPPIGLMYIAQALRSEKFSPEVKIIDAVAEGLTYDELMAITRQFNPDIVGLTSFTYTFYDVRQTAVEIKKILPAIPIVVGGPHMFFFPEETMTHSCFDYGIVGDGETSFAQLCLALLNGKSSHGIKGVIYSENGKIHRNGVASEDDIDKVAVPAIDLLDTSKYFSTLGTSDSVGTICTSRGCPFKCTFCQVPEKVYRKRSIENVLAEMEAYIDLGVTDFFFFDDLFNLSEKRVIEICDEILRRKLKVGWMFRGRAEQISDKMMSIAKKAGLHTISIGIEAATDEGMKEIKKQLTIEKSFEAVAIAKKYGVRCSTNWIIGFPHQRTYADLEHLLDVAIKMDSDYAQFSVLQLLPGCELYDEAVQSGGLDPEVWRNYVLNPVESFNPPIWEIHFTKKELFDFYEKAFKKYYLRPKVMLRELFRIRSFNELLVKLKGLTQLR